MKIRIIFFVLFIGFAAMMISCGLSNRKKAANLSPNAHEVVAEEVIQTSRYTYVRVSADNQEYWVAITKADIKEGKTYYWSNGAEMKEFTSKELKRTFQSIFFVQDFTDQPITTTNPVPAPQSGGKQPPIEHEGILVPRAEGGVTIAELSSKRSSLAGKTIKIRGEVVNFAGGIMKKNWVHIQDGTRDGNKFDLTITTQDSVKVGDVVLFEGLVTLEKDFGAGYFYDIIVEDAVRKK
ncbi:MAG: GW dipeptide domain-containing protein [Bacteroidales bacterium]|nr:GW dipeptide domain-containing protein [Bacteroidales bacterium]